MSVDGESIAIGALLCVVGGLLIAFPFAAPMTVAANGIAGSKVLIRGLGAILVLFGVVFLILAALG